MRKEEFLNKLSSGLAQLGWPAKHMNRVVQETSDHWDDLQSEQGHGSDTTVKERIGEPEALIRLHQETMRKTNWSGRHPVVTFALMPAVLLNLWFLGWTLMATSASDVYQSLLELPYPIWSSYLLVLIWATVIHYTGAVAVPAALWWWAGRSFCGPKWGWIACGACALHGFLNHMTVHPNSLHWGYGFAAPDWLLVLAPLLVGAAGHWHGQAKLHNKVAMAFLMVTLATGCATSKQPQERGWIGGEYKRAAAGVLITRLSTNTPAARSGLREGDLILSVDGTPVQNLRAFRKRVDASPGTRMSMEVTRDGANSQHDLVVGREQFKPDRSITVGVLLSREWDLWPNPGFSLVALGYKRQDNRLELDSPESRFDLAHRSKRAADVSRGLRSREGWEVWLPICSFSNRKRILAQTIE